LPHVTWLRAFEAAARHSAFISAADELHPTPAAVSQQIRLLEKHLGIQRFKRFAKRGRADRSRAGLRAVDPQIVS